MQGRIEYERGIQTPAKDVDESVYRGAYSDPAVPKSRGPSCPIFAAFLHPSPAGHHCTIPRNLIAFPGCPSWARLYSGRQRVPSGCNRVHATGCMPSATQPAAGGTRQQASSADPATGAGRRRPSSGERAESAGRRSRLLQSQRWGTVSAGDKPLGRTTVRARPRRLRALSDPHRKYVLYGGLYGHAGRFTAKNGGLRPGRADGAAPALGGRATSGRHAPGAGGTGALYRRVGRVLDHS